MFLITITKNGNLIPKEALGCIGEVIYVVATLVPPISNTNDLISSSMILLIWPFLTLEEEN